MIRIQVLATERYDQFVRQRAEREHDRADTDGTFTLNYDPGHPLRSERCPLCNVYSFQHDCSAERIDGGSRHIGSPLAVCDARLSPVGDANDQ